MNRRVELFCYHIYSRRLLLFVIMFLSSIVFVDNGLGEVSLMIAFVIILMLKFYKINLVFLIIILLAFLAGNRWCNYYLSKNYLGFKDMVGTVVYIKGKVVEDAEKVSGQKVKLVIKDEAIGRILVYLDKYPSHMTGEILSFEGMLEEAPEFEDFSYKRHLQTEGIFFVIKEPENVLNVKNEKKGVVDYIYNYKNSKLDLIKKRFSYPASAIVSGMAFGVRSDFSEEFEEGLTKSGTMHIVAISGFNISVLFSGLLVVGRFFNKKLFNLICFVLLLFFLAFVGIYNYSAFRAVVFSGVAITGKILGKRIIVSNMIAISILIILFFNPLAYRSASFLFSLSAIVGVFYVSNVFKFGSTLATTFAVSILTGLLQIYMFKNFSLIGVVVNIIISPLVSMSTIGSVVYILLTSVNQYLANLLAMPVALIIEVLMGIINIASRFDLAYVEKVSINLSSLLVFVSVIFYVTFNNFYLKIAKKLSKRQ